MRRSMRPSRVSCLVVCLLLSQPVFGAIWNIEEHGVVAEDGAKETMWANQRALNQTLGLLQPGDTLLVPNKTFHLFGGVVASGLRNVTFQIDGTLSYANDRHEWPTDATGRVLECLSFLDIEDVTFTSSGQGTFDGNGKEWWGAIKYLIFRENRPRLFYVYNSSRIVVEHLLFKDSPYWTTLFKDISDVTIRYCDISVHWGDAPTHTIKELQAFNTDGFDLSGRNVHIHDCNIWNDDDSVCVKDLGDGGHRARCSENWLVERVNASGLGLVVGSIGASPNTTCVRNITFRDSIMVNTFKGIYLKSRASGPGKSATISNILYQNITMYSPEQWAIWIGPAQQADSAGACSLLWPEDPFSKCPVPAEFTWDNITLRDITIINPKQSPGVIIGNSTNPMKNIVFDNVVVHNPSPKPWPDYYACYEVQGVATGGTSPVPPCFNGGAQCLADGKCMSASRMPCCSGESHATIRCAPERRCGPATDEP